MTEPHREYDELRKASFGWIKQASKIAMDRLGRADVVRKSDLSPVTEADHAVQDALLESIARLHPADAVITEETQAHPEAHQAVSQAKRCWVVDPIDGTRNYARSIPIFTLSVALMEDGRPVIGLVYDPVSDRMYSASTGGGAWLNSQRLTPPSEPAWGEAYISIPTSKHEHLPAVVHRWIDTMVVRNFGSTALHLALLAAGSLDAVYCRKSKLWDVAAGSVIAMETGMQVLSLRGEPHFPMELAGYTNRPLPMLAARPELLRRLLAEYQAGDIE